MTPLEAWLRGLSSDACGVYRAAWLTDAGDERETDGLTDAIAEQRRGEVVGRCTGRDE